MAYCVDISINNGYVVLYGALKKDNNPMAHRSGASRSQHLVQQVGELGENEWVNGEGKNINLCRHYESLCLRSVYYIILSYII